MMLATDDLIQRFLIHLMPKGFRRIRHYGLLANGNRAANIAHSRELLAMSLEVNRQFVPGRRLHRQVGGLAPLRCEQRRCRTWHGA